MCGKKKGGGGGGFEGNEQYFSLGTQSSYPLHAQTHPHALASEFSINFYLDWGGGVVRVKKGSGCPFGHFPINLITDHQPMG